MLRAVETHEIVDGVIVFRIVGRPDTQAFIEVLRRVVEDDAIPDGLAILMDVREAKGSPTQPQIRAVSEFFKRHDDAFGRRGMVVASKLQYGLARVSQALTHNRGMRMEIFWDENEALAALRQRIAAG